MANVKSSIPNSITSLNLLSGCMAVYMAFHMQDSPMGLAGIYWVYIFIGVAAVFDFCDGLSARALKAYSALGKELDSLSDLVSFGVAPGMLMLNVMQGHGVPTWICLISLLIPVLGALRLARFNVDDTQSHTFRGLPIPANAIFWIGFSNFLLDSGLLEHGPATWAIAAAVVVVMSSTMIMPARIFSLKFQNLSFGDNVKRYGLVLITVALVLLYGITGLMWTIVAYILISLLAKNKD